MDEREQPYPVLSSRAIIVGGALLVIFGVGLAVLLMITLGDGRHADQLDAIKTAGTIVVGTGGAAALWLTARRQRTTEIGLNQKHADQQATERAHLHTAFDAEARRITDLYGKAVEQIGSDKAAVRLAGFYALERLAQDTVGQRQTITNVLCAYLRMPSGENPEEAEVRQTVQRLLAAHLRGDEKYWTVEIDLSGANLVTASFEDCYLHSASFVGATFEGPATFDRARFGNRVSFAKARFTGLTRFVGASFDGEADLTESVFRGPADFANTEFNQRVTLAGAVFEDECHFWNAIFRGAALLGPATFSGFARFDNARFEGTAATWLGTTFEAGTQFSGAVFSGSAYFPDCADLSGAQFAERPWITVPDDPAVVGPSRWFIAQDGSGIVVTSGSDLPLHLSGQVQYLEPGVVTDGPDGPQQIVYGTWDESVDNARTVLAARLGPKSTPRNETTLPLNPVPQDELWSDLWYSGWFVEALDRLAEPGDLDQLAARGSILADIGYATLAVADLDQVLAEEPWRPHALSARAYALATLGRAEEAERDFARALKVAPHHAWTYFRRALLSNDAADARAALEANSPGLTMLQTPKARAMAGEG
ncbi:pentapeptide repeat-containing protein [Lentzea sp. NPDC004789]